MEDLRKVLRPVAMKIPCGWVLFWQKALFALWDTVGANTFSTERLHVAHQQLLPGAVVGAALGTQPPMKLAFAPKLPKQGYAPFSSAKSALSAIQSTASETW